MNDTIRQFRNFFVSIKLTVILLVLGLLLVFAATIDQVHLGIWAIQEKWFRSFFVLQDVRGILLPIFPGGYLIGGFLLVNLVAAHVYRFKFTWGKAGIQLTHIGLIMLLVGELFTGLLQEDFSMRLNQNEPKNYSESFRDNELALVDTGNPQFDEVVAIPETVVARGGEIQHAKLPFRVAVREYYPNSSLRSRESTSPGAANLPPSKATKGIGLNVAAFPIPMTYKQEERNIPAAFVELLAAEGSLGIWMVSADPRLPPQKIEHGGRTFTLQFRFTRAYKPFTLTLLKFSHDRYAGTEIPKNFSSRIRLQTPNGQDDREVLIYMNNPLRYSGMTFYQASFDPENPNVTILQVVRNPSWLMPYIACSLMTFGLLWQFGIHLFAFVSKRRPALQSKTA
ncbi:cytochrome c biogenesis protein ResB [Horticoccus sp. 23ND18S-11]|uniref:cytochrome c biogenesis protein ResB n=1 Tax=Horticoccus sp. 23ND18S-11 TaxID=3391832 RepID=UPI0039C930CE